MHFVNVQRRRHTEETHRRTYNGAVTRVPTSILIISKRSNSKARLNLRDISKIAKRAHLDADYADVKISAKYTVNAYTLKLYIF